MSSLIGGFYYALSTGPDGVSVADSLLLIDLAGLLRGVGDQRFVLGDGLGVTVQVVDLGIFGDFHGGCAGKPVVVTGEALAVGSCRESFCGCFGCLVVGGSIGNLGVRCACAQSLRDHLDGLARSQVGHPTVRVQVSSLFSQVEAVDNTSAAEILIALDAVSPREGERLLDLLSGHGGAVDQLLRQQGGDVRCRHGGAALVDVGELGVIRAVEAVHGQGEDVFTRCGDVDPRAVVGERCSRAGLGCCADRDDAHAVGGRVLGRLRVAVTGRGDHDCALGACNVDGALVRGGALGYGADGHIDDLGGVGVVRHAVNVSAGSPDDGVGNVGGAATASAQHAHGLHTGEVGGTNHAHAVIAAGADNAGNAGAVPGGGVGVRLILAEVVGRVVAFTSLGLGSRPSPSRALSGSLTKS